MSEMLGALPRVGFVLDGRWRRDALLEPMQNAPQQRRGDQIRIGIGAGHAMFQTRRGALPFRHAHGSTAMIAPPVALDRREAVGLKAAVGIAVRREDRLTIEQAVHHAADGSVEMSGAVVAIEDIVAVFIEHTDVQMHARSRLIGVGLAMKVLARP